MTLTTARRASAVAFGVAAVLLLGLLTYLTTRRHRDATAWVAHTYEVLASIEAVQSRTVDAETGVRGFAATGEPRFLEPYDGAERDARRELARLRRLTADNAGQQPRLDSLEAGLARVFAHLDSTIDVIRARVPSTTQLAAGKALMDRVRASAAVVGAEERRLLAMREEEDRRLALLTAGAVLGETIAAAACVLVVGLLLGGAARAQQRHAAAEHEARLRAEASAQQLQEQAVELELRTAEAERARAEAESANRAKADLLSTVSHELRTPLNAIGGYAELLEIGVRGPLTAAQREDLARIRRANQHLTGLVTDILNFARLEAGQVEFHLDDCPLAPLLADLHTLVAPQLEAKAIVFDAGACAPDAHGSPHDVRADPEKLRQVLVNLLSNAVKFTEPGGRVTLACDADRAAGVVQVRVRDTGRGIAPEQLGRIFEPFVQVDRHRTPQSQQGVGLGLAISRDLVRGMGGELAAESVPGEGSTFTVTLPAAGPTS